jgi:hypothetical protein
MTYENQLFLITEQKVTASALSQVPTTSEYITRTLVLQQSAY